MVKSLTMFGFQPSDRCMRYFGLCLACASITMAGTILTFTTFASDLKNQFGLTQQAVELIASMGNLGACLGYPSGLIHERIGNVRSYVLAMVLSGVSALVLFGTQYFSNVCHRYWSIFIIFWMLYGFGTSFMFLVSSAISMDNFPLRHRGLIVGLTGAFFWIGPTLFGIIYASGFGNGPIGDFFFCLAVAIIIINILSILFIRPIPLEVEDSDETEVALMHVSFVTEPEDSELTFADRIGWSHFKLPAFQLLNWGFLAGASVQLMYFANVTIYVNGYAMSEMDEVMPIVGPLCGVIFTLGSGVLSDHTLKYTSRLTYIIVGTIIQALVFVISAFYGDNVYVFVVTTVVIYSNNGIYWSLIPALISEYFGMKHFTRNWGLELMANALLALAMCAIFAIFYDNAIMLVNPSDTECFGLHCFSKSYGLASVFSFISVGLFAILCIKEHRLRIQLSLAPLLEKHENIGYESMN